MIENKVLIIEDEIIERQILVELFKKEGFTVFDSPCATGALQLVAREGIPLVLLDDPVDSGGGLTLTRQLRAASHVGIVLISQRSEDIDRVIGLEVGADAYVAKPIFPREVMSIGKRLIVRVNHAEQAKHNPKNTVKFGDWKVESKRQMLQHLPSSTSIKLTSDECSILLELFTSFEEILSRDHLLEKLKGRTWEVSDRTIDILIGRIRKKTGVIKGATFPIESVYGRGYTASLSKIY